MAREVKASGPLDAPIMIVGEAPGGWEARSGVPFVGPSGKMLGEWLRGAGLTRSQCRVDNVYRFQPPGNNLAKAPRSDVEDSAAELHERVARLNAVKIIVPTGNYALRALLRKPLWDNRSPKISDWRGSVLSYDHPTLGPVHLIPTIHPAACFRRPTLEPLCVMDWKKISGILTHGMPPAPKHEHNIAPTRKDAARFKAAVERAYGEAPKDSCLALDIETSPKAGELICVGFALDERSSITFMWRKWRKTIRWLCQHPIAKVMQNGHYDTYWLRMKAGIEVVNWKWDTLAMHHCLRPYLPHNLGTQLSLYTMNPFHKNSAKDEDSIKAERTPYRALARYNGKDCTGTRELKDIHYQALKRAT